MSDKPSRTVLSPEELTLHAVGLADAALAARVERAAASDEELTAKLSFMRAMAGGDSDDEPDLETDHRDLLALPEDSRLGRRLKTVKTILELGDEKALRKVFSELIQAYGRYAKALLGEFFPSIKNVHQLLQDALIRVAENVSEFDESKESLRVWFLTIVHQEAITFLRREVDDEHEHLKGELTKRLQALEEGASPETSGEFTRWLEALKEGAFQERSDVDDEHEHHKGEFTKRLEVPQEGAFPETS